MFMTVQNSPFSVGSISAGALLGTTGTAELVRSINDSLGGGGLISSAEDIRSRNNFIAQVLQPIQMGRMEVMHRVNVLMNPDIIRPLRVYEDFAAIPPSMYEAIIMFPPVKILLEQGRISGFGFDPEYLPEEDVWGRLISNGTCEETPDADGKRWMSWTWRSSDPKATFEDIENVEITRQSIEHLINTTRWDPTDWKEERG